MNDFLGAAFDLGMVEVTRKSKTFVVEANVEVDSMHII